MKTVFTLLTAACLALTANMATADIDLAKKKGCLTCHQVDKKVVGPAYKDVAKKYKGDGGAEAHLLGVIKKGGKGVWGKVPMPAQAQVSDSEAKTLVQWVLSQ